ncbi:hypothetical protein [Polluticoccus soli]|uniref:hypothetical protein n=1 Tax=Polluticoccus soli TaxID=3034150 RepID=UPI0023E2C94A|nr:hypothetical protein [Flavipsychrobacter sp. JY13-12]
MGKNFTNNGSFTQNNGTLVFSGTTQTMNGSTATTLKNISVSNNSTTTVSTAGHSLTEVLISNGTLNASGNLTLLSTASKTALVDGSSTGDVLDIIMQRYIPSAYGYKYFSSPYQAATVNEFSDEVSLNANFPPVYRYEEDNNATGWFFHKEPTDALTPLKGYAVNFGTTGTPVTADMRGDANNGPMSVPVSNNNRTYTQGFNLVGNPYPSPIDWNASTGWTRTNVDDAIYYFDASNSDQYNGTYSSYINGVSSNGIASNIIPAMQGFFVHVSDGSYPVSGTLGMTNAVRVNNLSPFFHKSPGKDNPLIRINARYSGVSKDDATVIYFDKSSQANFELQYDALKILNTDSGVPNLYVSATDGNKLSISAIPYPSDSIDIVPLGLETKTDGEIEFTVSDIENMPGNTYIYFADSKNRIVSEVNAGSKYKSQLPAGKHENRYAIVFSKKTLAGDIFSRNELNAYSSQGKLYVYLNLITGDKGTLTLVNTLGQIIAKHELNGFGYHEIPVQLSNGVYIASFYSQNGVFSKKMFLGND